jgi:choline dehydrogenase-like flavoprotein
MAKTKDDAVGRFPPPTVMAKTKDDAVGRITGKGKISNPLTKNDQKRLDKGSEISKEILQQTGVDPKTFYTSHVRGTHPGGTAGIGHVVNKDLETEINRLFVCDCSVLPVAPGLPPVVTIVALAKKLSKS